MALPLHRTDREHQNFVEGPSGDPLRRVLSVESDWSITAQADNAPATATRAGEAGKSHYITSIGGSFSVSNLVKSLQLKDGGVAIQTHYVNSTVGMASSIEFAHPVKITAGAAAEITLLGSGTAGQIGTVTMTGYTR